MDALNKQLARLHDHLKNQTAQHATVMEKSTGLEKEVSSLKSALSRNEAERIQLEQKAKDLNHQALTKEQAKDDMGKMLQALKQQLEEKINAQAASTSQIQQLNAEGQRLKGYLEGAAKTRA